MKILYTFLNFNGLTGSELYYYELSREMVKLGHDVTIASNIGGSITEKAINNGVKCIDYKKIPASLLKDIDVIHCSHVPVFNFLTQVTNKPVVATIHSEILEIEKIESNKVNHYIAIRPTIYNQIQSSNKTLIYNPFDFSRFNNEYDPIPLNVTADCVLFPGTIDYLRTGPMFDLINKGNKIIVTSEDINVAGDIQSIKPLFNIEWYTKICKSVGGIIKGRTYIEAMLCGKDYHDYTVDEKGKILKYDLIKPKDNSINFFSGLDGDIPKYRFDSKHVAEEVEKIYNRIV